VTEVLEIERKYDVDGPFEPPTGLPGVTAVDGPEQDTLDAAYYDTADLRLLRSGATLRRRTGGPDAGWHLKLPAGEAGERTELRLPLGRRRTVPKELVDLTMSRSRGAPLAQVARLRTERTRWRLLDGDTPVAEVVADAVRAEVSGEQGVEDAGWNEVEVELLAERRELLADLEPALRERGARPASSSSKVGRALAGVLAGVQAAVQPEPTGRPAEDSAGAVVLAYLREQVDAIVAIDPKVRRDEPDAVHQLRVAARRARSTLQSFRRILDRERTEPVVAELRWLGTVLTAAREAEAQRERLCGQLRSLPAELLPGSVTNRVDSHLFREYSQAREAVLGELRGKRYLALLDALQRLLDDPPLAGEAGKPAAKVLPRLAGRAQRRVRRAFARCQEAGTGRDAALHEMRKAAKRARYAVEAVRPVAGKPARRSAKRLKAVQRVLGHHQDTVVSRTLVRDLGLRAHGEGDNAFGYGVLLGRDLAFAERLREELPDLWRRADRSRTRRWMARRPAR